MRTTCLYFGHTVTDTAEGGLKDQTRRQEMGASRSPWSVGTTVRRQTSVMLGQRAHPCCLSERGHVVESMVQLLADSLVLELLSVQLV